MGSRLRMLLWWCLPAMACSAEAASPPRVDDTPRDEVVVAEVQTPGHVGVVLAGAAVDVAPTSTGEVIEVHVRVGDPVHAGQVLATLDDGDARGALRMAEARLDALHSELAVADLELAEAERKLGAERKLAGSGATSEHTLAEAEFAATRAAARRKATRAAHVEQRAVVDQRRRQLGHTTIVAPFSGSVSRVYREPGAAVGPSLPVARIVGTQGVRVRFAMPPEDARRLAIGDALVVEVETITAPVAARVRQIAAQVDAASRLVIVEGEIVDPTNDVHPGLAARVRRRDT